MIKESGIEIVSTAIQVFTPSEEKIELSKARTELQSLIEKHKNIVLDLSLIEDKKERKEAYDAAKEAWKEYKVVIEFEDKCKATYDYLKSQISDYKKSGDEISAEWRAELNKFHKAWKDEDDRKKIESARIAQEELDRIAHIKSRIEDFKNLHLSQINSDSETLDTVIRNIILIEINESFQEFKTEAQVTKDLVLTTLQNMFNAKLSAEKIAIHQAEENARLEAERKAFEQQKAQQLAEQADKEKVERQRIAEEDRIRNEKIAEEKRIRDAEVAAQQKILDDKQAELDRQAQLIANKKREETLRIEKEESEKIESERLKKEQKEKERAAQAYKNKIEKMDALEAFKYIKMNLESHDVELIDVCDAQIRKLDLKKAS